MAQSQNEKAKEVLEIINIDDESRKDVVKDWVNSNNSDQYKDLKKDANNWLNEVAAKKENINKNYDGVKIVSDGLKVHYKFNASKETVNLYFKADSDRSVSIADIGSALEGNRGKYINEYINGNKKITMEAKETRESYGQAISIADSKGERFVIIKANSDTDLFDKIKWWYVVLGAIVGSLTLAILTVRYIRKKEEKGKGEIIPLGENV